MASFASSILSSKDHPSLVLGALQLVDLLLGKVSALYKPTFRREGVFHEIEALAERAVTSGKSKDKDKDGAEGTDPAPVSVASIPGFKKLTSLSLDPEDAITLRARVIQFKYLGGEETADEDNAFENLRRLVDRLSKQQATEKELITALWELADLFSSPHTSVSSFELLQSGVVDGILLFLTDENRTGRLSLSFLTYASKDYIQVAAKSRKELFLDAFSGRKLKALTHSHSPFVILVKKLQESLTRMEAFDVITVAQNSDGKLAMTCYIPALNTSI